jgi:two-component system sensor histidine kinase TctE
MAPLAAVRDVDLEFEARLDAAPIRAHAPALHDILINLIDNAIRYNASGGSVVVSVFFEDGRYLTRVSDNGPGIAPEHRERVFDRFYRIPANDRPPGSGLGLSIVRTLLQQSAGTIALSDGIGGAGLAVIIAFPAA